MTTIQRNGLVWLLGFGLILFYWFLSQHIDFHPDEAIYFDAIPVSIRNDAGVFFSTFYLLVTHWLAGPEGARLASTILGGATFIVMARTIGLVQPLSIVKATILFTAFAVSYQAIFVFVRVRPEAAWWFCATLVLYAAVWFETRTRSSKVGAWPLAVLLIAVLLLPMNHRLSWFACAFMAGYALLFLWREKGLRVAVAVWITLFAGVILNIVLRAWWTGISLHEAFTVAMNSTGTPRQPVREFMHLVFYGAPLFLGDTAQNANLYEWLTGSKSRALSHAFIQNSLWLLMFVLPLIGNTWKERYIFAFPAFALSVFWLAGYYNPTYSAGFSLFCVMVLAYSWPVVSGWRRKLAWAVLVISVVNGLSFIATRVLHHGDATYFAAEKAIRQVAEQLSLGQSIAVPERFMPTYMGLPVHSHVNFKMDIPADVDVLVIDSYDMLMYGFVPDFEVRKQALLQQAERMCLVKRIATPVYEGDELFGGHVPQTLQVSGSWFFRNSAAYTLSIYRKCDLKDGKQY